MAFSCIVCIRVGSRILRYTNILQEQLVVSPFAWSGVKAPEPWVSSDTVAIYTKQSQHTINIIVLAFEHHCPFKHVRTTIEYFKVSMPPCRNVGAARR
jgi:hypothetical protein